MTAWGVVAVCAVGGGAAGPLLDGAARRVRRDPVADPAAAPVLVANDPLLAVATAPAAELAAPPAATVGQPGRRASVAEAVAAGVVTAVLCALAAVRLGDVPELAAYCVLFGALTALSIVDLRVGLVPRRFLYPALGLVAVALVGASASQHEWHALLEAAVGAAAGFAVFAAIWWVYPRGMGFGDVRLAGLCGLGLGWLGYRQLYLGFLAGFVLGALMGLVVLAVRGSRRFPFAPAMAAGTAFGVLWGGWLGNLWLHPG